MNRFLLFFLFLFFLLLPVHTFSQWSTDPTINLTICDTAGEQALTKNFPTNDGGCYISWFDNRSGNYAVYLQKLDALGNKLFPQNGLLISSNPQSSSLVDYDLAVDNSNNAILAFTDSRNGSDINPFAYKISPAGEFLWGANGVSLADTFSVFQANPKVVCTSDGNYYFSWIYASSPQRKIAMQKLNSAGVKQFSPSAIYLVSPVSNENYDWPWHIASDNGSIILLWSGYTGSFLTAGNYKLYSQKFSATGTPVWNTTRDTVYKLGRVSGFYTPRIFSDGNNGAVYCWQDDRNAINSSNCYVQRQKADGTFLFPIDGSVVATNVTFLRFEPIATYMPETKETFVYWQEKNSLQSLIGINGQKFDSLGLPLWPTNDGISFKPMDGNSFSSLILFNKNSKVFAFYNEILTASVNCTVKGFANTNSGAFIWPGTGIVDIGSSPSSKIRMWASMTTADFFVLSWEDERLDGGIYAQKIDVNGLLPVELVSFTSEVSGRSVNLNWSTSSEKNNKGFTVERRASADKWLPVTFIAGYGTSTEQHHYAFTDNNVGTGKYEYRLKQTDLDGSFTYSKTVQAEVSVPAEYTLMQNYPNPFNPSTQIRFSIPLKGNVTLKIYDALGEEVLQLINGEKEAGNYEINFSAATLSSGIYFYRLTAGEFTTTKKMLLLR